MHTCTSRGNLARSLTALCSKSTRYLLKVERSFYLFPRYAGFVGSEPFFGFLDVDPIFHLFQYLQVFDRYDGRDGLPPAGEDDSLPTIAGAVDDIGKLVPGFRSTDHVPLVVTSPHVHFVRYQSECKQTVSTIGKAKIHPYSSYSYLCSIPLSHSACSVARLNRRFTWRCEGNLYFVQPRYPEFLAVST